MYDPAKSVKDGVLKPTQKFLRRAFERRQLVPPQGLEKSSPERSGTEVAAAFPLDTLPAQLQALIEKTAAAIHCPSDFLGVPLLAAAGAAIGNSRAVEIKEGWTERARLWVAVVADPGTKKSPALSLITTPFRKRNKEFFQESSNPEAPVQVLTTDTTMAALAALLEANPRGILVFRDELVGWVRSMNGHRGGGSDRQK